MNRQSKFYHQYLNRYLFALAAGGAVAAALHGAVG